MTRNITILIAALLIADVSAQTSVVYRNFVDNADGAFCEATYPESGFMIWLNGDRDRALFENAPRWEEGVDSNINGQGSYAVELGNFRDPALQAGTKRRRRLTRRRASSRRIRRRLL